MSMLRLFSMVTAHNPMENLVLLSKTTAFSLFIICLVLFDRKLVDLVSVPSGFCQVFQSFQTLFNYLFRLQCIHLSCFGSYTALCTVGFRKICSFPDSFHRRFSFRDHGVCMQLVLCFWHGENDRKRDILRRGLRYEK